MPWNLSMEVANLPGVQETKILCSLGYRETKALVFPGYRETNELALVGLCVQFCCRETGG
jgi:hypothetical protein